MTIKRYNVKLRAQRETKVRINNQPTKKSYVISGQIKMQSKVFEICDCKIQLI